MASNIGGTGSLDTSGQTPSSIGGTRSVDTSGQQLALQMPDTFQIGTQTAFQNNSAFLYTKKQAGSEILYICGNGSKWARANEQLVLRYVPRAKASSGGIWTAYDSDVNQNGTTLQCRQAVFRCIDDDITQPGWHVWEINYASNKNGDGLYCDWQGQLWAETKVP